MSKVENVEVCLKVDSNGIATIEDEFITGLKRYDEREDRIRYSEERIASLNEAVGAIKKVVLSDNIKEIKQFCFSNFKSMEEIILNPGLEEIGEYAFSNCSNLKRIQIPGTVRFNVGYFDSANTFANCENLEEVVLEDGIKSLNGRMFENCTNLKEVKYSDSVKKIGVKVFSNCKNLKRFTIEKGIEKIGTGAFENCESLEEIVIKGDIKECDLDIFANCPNLKKIIFEEGVTQIPEKLLENIKSIEEIVISDSVTKIGDNAFKGLSGLKKIKLPENLTRISDGMLAMCTSLEEIIIPSHVTEIGDSAFKSCSNLKNIILNDELNKIEAKAFECCEKLEKIKMPKSLKKIGRFAFSQCSSLNDIELNDGLERVECGCFGYCSSLENIILPDSIESLGDGYYSDEKGMVFNSCDKLKNIKLSKNLKIIMPNLFCRCKSLDNIVIPENVEKIEYGAFYHCESLKNIKLNSNLKEMGYGAFESCIELEDINFPDSLTKINDCFGYCSKFDVSKIPLELKLEKDNVLKNLNLEDIKDGVWYIPEGTKIVDLYDEFLYEYAKDGTKELRNSVKKIVFPKGVEKIGKCIKNFENLEEVVMSDTITAFQEENFENCNKLKNVRISRNLKQITSSMLRKLAKLDYLIIPNNCEVIGDDRDDNYFVKMQDYYGHNIDWYRLKFLYANKNKRIYGAHKSDQGDLDDRVTINAEIRKELSIKDVITDGAVSNEIKNDYSKEPIKNTLVMDDIKNLDEIVTITISAENINKIGAFALSQCPNLRKVVIEEGIKEIGIGAFAGCDKLEEVVFPKSLRKIDDLAFYGCESLQSIEIESKKIDIGDEAFKKCASLEWVTLPSDVGKIGIGAFAENNELKSVTGYKNVDKICDYAFGNCKKLSVHLPMKLRELGSYSFINCGTQKWYEDDFESANKGMIILPHKLARIGQRAFEGCLGLTNIFSYDDVNLPVLEDRVFANCKNLEFLEIPKTVRVIGDECYKNCSKITELCLPEALEKIGKRAFENCRKIKRIISLGNRQIEKMSDDDAFKGVYATNYCVADLNTEIKVDKKTGEVSEVIRKQKDKKKISFNSIKKSIEKIKLFGKKER